MTSLPFLKGLLGSGPDHPGPRVAVFGDSHTAALHRAAEFPKRKDLYAHISIKRLRKEKDGRSVGDTSLSAFCKEIQRYGKRDFVFSAVGGNQYAIVSTVRGPVDFDFLVSPTDEDVGSDEAELVPLRAMASHIEAGVRGTDGPVLRALREATRARLFHLVPPPPKEDNAFIQKQFESRFAEEGLTEFGPTRPALRLKCWRLQLSCLERLCAELDIELVLPPREALTEEGYLAPPCYGSDVTHGNRRYGELVLRQILTLTGAELRGDEGEA